MPGLREPDILSDLQARLLIAGLDRDAVQRVTFEARRFWGGQEVYVRAGDQENRDAAIRAALEKGLSVQEVMRCTAVSRSTVYRKKRAYRC
jgi:Mor family transcriptional regulator